MDKITNRTPAPHHRAPIDEPLLTRRRLLAAAQITGDDLANWMRRGYLNRQAGLYSARDVLTCMCLSVTSRAGVPLTEAEAVTAEVRAIAGAKMAGGAGSKPFYLLFTDEGCTRVPADHFEPPVEEWFTVIDVNAIADRFIEVIGQ